MDSKSLAIFYYAVRISHTTRLAEGDIMLGFWRKDDKIAVSVLSKSSNDELTIQYCNEVTDYAEQFGFAQDIHIEPASWAPGDGDPASWMTREFKDNEFCLWWSMGDVYVSTGPNNITTIRV